MTPAPAAIQRLCDLLSDSALGRARVTLGSGQVLVDQGQQWAEVSDALNTEQAQGLRSWLTLKRGVSTAPLFEVEESGLRLRCLRPPLIVGDEQLWVERARRVRTPLHQLVSQGWLRGEEALTLNRTLQQGGNILITSLRPSDAHTLLDALLELPDSASGEAFFIGDTRKLDARDLRLSCIDRRAFGALDEAARLSLDAWLLEARWVFCDLLASSEDVRFWSGGVQAKGRVGVVIADGPQEALHRLHALVFPQAQLPRTHVPGLVDLLVFVDRRQTGSPQALIWQVDMAAGYLVAVEEGDAYQEADSQEQEQWQQEEVSLDPAADMTHDAPAAPDAPAGPEVSTGLAEAMSSAFAGFGNELFSLEDEEQGEGRAAAAPAAAAAPKPAARPTPAPKPAPAADPPALTSGADAALPEMGLSFEPDELDDIAAPEPPPASNSTEFMFGPGELDDDEPPAPSPTSRPTAGAPSARRPPPASAPAASGTSRYNPEAIRQDAERIRNERAAAGGAGAGGSRYRPPTPADAAALAQQNPAARRSASLPPMGAPGAAAPARSPSSAANPTQSPSRPMAPAAPAPGLPSPAAPSIPPPPRPTDPAAARRSGLFERAPDGRSGNWRKPTGTDVRPAAAPTGARAVSRPLSGGGMRRPVASIPGTSPEELPILQSTDIEALEDDSEFNIGSRRNQETTVYRGDDSMKEGNLPDDAGEFNHESTRLFDPSNPPPMPPPKAPAASPPSDPTSNPPGSGLLRMPASPGGTPEGEP